jgi:hypothetical protein
VLRHEAHPTRVSEELFERAIFGLRLVVIVFADEFTIDLFVRDQVIVKAKIDGVGPPVRPVLGYGKSYCPKHGQHFCHQTVLAKRLTLRKGFDGVERLVAINALRAHQLLELAAPHLGPRTIHPAFALFRVHEIAVSLQPGEGEDSIDRRWLLG